MQPALLGSFFHYAVVPAARNKRTVPKHCPLSALKGLERNNELRPEGPSMLIGFFTFEVVVFDGSNHILSEGDVAANVVTLEAFTVKFVPSTIHGVVNDSQGLPDHSI